MSNEENISRQSSENKYTNSEQLIMSTANILKEINVPEVQDAKKKILERKAIIEEKNK